MTLTTKGPAVIGATSGPLKAFEDAEALSRADRGDDVKAKDMYLQGSNLIYGNCNAFFDKASSNQTKLLFARDATGAITAVTASIFALTNAKKTALAIVGIGGTAVYSGIDLVTKDYLFSAENVEAVRTLVDKALSTHNTAVLAAAADRPFSYDFASKQLFDEQAMCTMQSIASLAHDAIKNGHLTATSSTLEADELSLAQTQDSLVLQSLGMLLQTPGPLSINQAGAFWWYLKDHPTPAEVTTIAGMLTGLPTATSPFDANKAPVVDWSLGTQVVGALDRFSPGTQAQLEKVVAQARTPAPGRAFVSNAPPTFFLNTTTVAAGDHIEVRVK
jgi:hypothetical protein